MGWQTWLQAAVVMASVGMAAPAQAQFSPGGSVSQCAYEACAEGKASCCAKAKSQKSSCQRTYSSQRANYEEDASGGEAAAAMLECVRCSAVYLVTYCGTPSPEASWKPQTAAGEGLRDPGVRVGIPAGLDAPSRGRGGGDGAVDALGAVLGGVASGIAGAAGNRNVPARSSGSVRIPGASQSAGPGECRSRYKPVVSGGRSNAENYVCD